MRSAAQMAASGHLEFQRLITHRFPLEKLGDAFNAAAVEAESGQFARVLASMGAGLAQHLNVLQGAT